MELTRLTELEFRIAAFVAVLLAMSLLEVCWPQRRLAAPKLHRWRTNLAIVALGSGLVRLMASAAVPIAALAAAGYAEASGIGLMNWLRPPGWIAVIISIVALDLAIWAQHLASHKLPLLWRLHQMHHADIDLDVTTALRFHPIEIGLSMLWKIVCVLVLGAPPIAVLAFEIILNGCAMFNHANVRLGPRFDRILRLVLVTPDMHRVHHSIEPSEHNSNYGFNFPFWDRLFGTYTDQPAAGHDGMTIGLARYQSERPMWLSWCLLLPFRRTLEHQRSNR